jgi:hypothetical protein
MRTREEIWQALDGNFKELMDCLGQLTEEEITSCPVCGIWTVKDVIAHVWSWHEEATRAIEAWTGPRPWQEGVTYDDAWNEAQVASRAVLPLITVVDGITGAHRRLMHQLDLANDAALVQKGRAPWGETMTLADFFYGMAEHCAAHVEDLANYQATCLDTTA